MLFYKLQKYGISGNFYKILKNMYLNTQFCIKTDKGLTKSFSSTIGVSSKYMLYSYFKVYSGRAKATSGGRFAN